MSGANDPKPWKPLVLCADDYALNGTVSRGIATLVEYGRLSATSVMVLSPRWGDHAARLRALRGRLDVGLHLDWTSDFAQAAGHGMTLGAAMRRAVLGGFDRDAARVVIGRQLDTFEAHWGAPPDHVDGHQHVHQFAGIREALVETLAHRYAGAPPWLRVSRAPHGQRDAKSRIIAALGARALADLAARAGVPAASALAGIYDFSGGEAAYARRMARWLATSPPGTVIMCHPADGVAHGEGADPIATARVAEFAWLAGDGFARALSSSGVHLSRGRSLYTRAP